MDRVRPFFVLGAILVSSLSPALTSGAPSAQQAWVHAHVWETLAKDGVADILVILSEQADLTDADHMATKEAKGRHVYDTLWTVAQETQSDLRASFDAQGTEYRSFYIVNAIQVRASSAQVHSLAARGDVARIVLNPPVKTLPDAPAHVSVAEPQGVESNLIRVNADDVWSLGYRGQGVVVAGQDTGYDWDHPALKDQYRGWDGAVAAHDYNWHDAIHSGGGICGDDSLQPCDDHGHGTHTLGILVGDDSEGNQIGMAPDARWIACRNMDQGVGTPATYLECFEFFLAPYPVAGTPDQGKPELAPHVVNNSWSCPASEGCDAGALEAAVESLRQAGIVVVVSAGNEGPACGSASQPPALYQQSLTVAAFDHASETIATFSSRGPVTYGSQTYAKPEIAAPGVAIRSSLRGGGYGLKYGTSMAAPHVAGAVALILSANPGYSGHVADIEAALTGSAEPRASSEGCGGDGPAQVPNNTWGWGILDAHAAVESALERGWIQGTVTNARDGMPIVGARVKASNGTQAAGGTTDTDAQGHYTLALRAGTYDLMVTRTGFASRQASGVVVIDDRVTNQDFSLSPLLRTYLPIYIRDVE